MLLPRDMTSLSDCLCDDDVDTAEAQDDEDVLGNFECRGRYKPTPGVIDPVSVEDCACYHPYDKVGATGECHLTSCPRAGNYEPKQDAATVTSLADCTCTTPYIKVERSGQCVLSRNNEDEYEDTDVARKAEFEDEEYESVDTMESDYECPSHSTATPEIQPRSFADCHCSWGYVRSDMEQCELERAAYVCPVHSTKRLDLPVGERPRGFFDCECLSDGKYQRDDDAHACRPLQKRRSKKALRKRRSTVDTDALDPDELDWEVEDEPFECPRYSRAVATVAHSIEQCQCLRGYGWKLPEMTCVRTSAYSCPAHAFKRKRKRGPEVETSFEDCACARGFFRDAVARRCVPWLLADDNTCPAYAVLTRWPLESSANCQCAYGLDETAGELESKLELEEEADEGTDEAHMAPMRRRKKVCNTSPPGDPNFSQCPLNSMAINWPVASSDDCVCLSGFEMAPLSDEEKKLGVGDGFRCVEVPDQLAEEVAAVCREPEVVHPLSGECRLPVEGVVNPTKTSLELERVMFKGIEYDFELVEGSIMVIQGDVAVGERLVWQAEANEDSKNVAGRVDHVLHGYFNSERDHRWPRAELCFQVDPSAKPFVRTLLAAVKHVTHATGFKFHRCAGDNCRSDMACHSHDIVIVRGVAASCFSFVGRIGGPQTLGLSADCGLGNVVHEILHTLGLRHAVDRPDRDQHVRVAWECVPEPQRSYFVAEDADSPVVDATAADRELPPPPYDFFSVMHHPVDAFVHSSTEELKPQWCPSIVPRIVNVDERLDVMRRMGQRERMTASDVQAIWALYPGLQRKHQQMSGEDGAAQVEDLHDAWLHGSDDVTTMQGHTHGGRSFGQRLVNFLTAVAILVGFGALLAFVMTEIRRRALLGSDAYYSESLLAEESPRAY